MSVGEQTVERTQSQTSIFKNSLKAQIHPWFIVAQHERDSDADTDW